MPIAVRRARPEPSGATRKAAILEALFHAVVNQAHAIDPNPVTVQRHGPASLLVRRARAVSRTSCTSLSRVSCVALRTVECLEGVP